MFAQFTGYTIMSY